MIEIDGLHPFCALLPASADLIHQRFIAHENLDELYGKVDVYFVAVRAQNAHAQEHFIRIGTLFGEPGDRLAAVVEKFVDADADARDSGFKSVISG